MKTHNKYIYALKNNKVTYFRSFKQKTSNYYINKLRAELKKTNDAVNFVTNIQHLHVICVCDENEKTGSIEAIICNICGKSETY